jgi:hypothetical protein
MIRFLKKIKRSKKSFQGDPCWEWAGAVQANGYGRFSLKEPDWQEVTKVDRKRKAIHILCHHPPHRTLFAHRVSHAFFNGPIPKGLMVDHLCHNTRCVNPAHLRLLTNSDNVVERNVRVAGRWQPEEVPF